MKKKPPPDPEPPVQKTRVVWRTWPDGPYHVFWISEMTGLQEFTFPEPENPPKTEHKPRQKRTKGPR